MAIVRVNVTGTTGASTPQNFDLPAINSVTGNFIIGAVGANNPLSSVTDTAGNTYTLLTAISGAATPSPIQGFYATNITGNASNVIHIHLSNTVFNPTAVAFEYSGVDTVSPLDQFASGFNNSPFNTQQTAAFTTTSANEAIVSFIAIDNARAYSAGGTQDATSPMILRIGSGGDATSAASLWAADNIVSSIQTGITAGYTGIDRFNMFVQTIKQASAPSFTFQQLTAIQQPLLDTFGITSY
jgi:hypothetical protein